MIQAKTSKLKKNLKPKFEPDPRQPPSSPSHLNFPFVFLIQKTCVGSAGSKPFLHCLWHISSSHVGPAFFSFSTASIAGHFAKLAALVKPASTKNISYLVCLSAFFLWELIFLFTHKRNNFRVSFRKRISNWSEVQNTAVFITSEFLPHSDLLRRLQISKRFKSRTLGPPVGQLA